MRTARHLVAFLLVLAMGCVLLCGVVTKGHNWGDDFAQYIMQARSLTEGRPDAFIAANRFTMEQSSRPIGPVTYPWGFPVLLAPLYAAFGPDMLVMKAVGILSYLLFLIVLWFGFRRVHPTPWLLCFLSIFAFNPVMLQFADNVLSDFPFLLLSTLSLILTGIVVVERRTLISEFWDHAVIGLTVTAAFFVRTNGFLLLITLAVSQLVAYLIRQQPSHLPKNIAERKSANFKETCATIHTKSLLLSLTPYLVFLVMSFVLHNFFPAGGDSYLDHLTSMSTSIVFRNIIAYIVLPSWFFASISFYGSLYILSIIFLPFSVKARYRSDYHIIIYTILTILMCVFWPYLEGLRFLFPILPFYISFMLTGMAELQSKVIERWHKFGRVACFVPVILMICWFGLGSARTMYRNLHGNRESLSGPFSKTASEMFSFINSHTQKDATIIFFKPRAMQLLANRRAIMIRNEDELARGDYLCMHLEREPYDQVEWSAVEKLLKAGAARLVYENAEFQLYDLQ